MKFLQEVKLVRGLFRSFARLVAAMTGMALGPGSAAAQEESIDTPYRWLDSGTRVGLVGGYMFTNRGDPPFGPGSSPFIGARLRARLSSPLSLEIGLGYGNSNEYVIDPRLAGRPGDRGHGERRLAQSSRHLSSSH